MTQTASLQALYITLDPGSAALDEPFMDFKHSFAETHWQCLGLARMRAEPAIEEKGLRGREL